MFQKTSKSIIQNTISPLFQYTVIQELKNDIILTTPININDTIINISSGHGFVIGDMFCVWENNGFEQAEIVNVVGDTITIEIPTSSPFSLNAKIIRGNPNLNLDGSINPIDIYFKMYNAIVPIDITAAIIQMQHGPNVPDDGKFAGIPALTNGLYFRQVNGHNINLGNYRKNIDFKLRGFSVNYTDKAPAGGNATEIIIDIPRFFGQVIRINPRDGDHILGKIRDNLSSLDYFRMSLVGSFTEG
jgi:hypothetical protein